MQWVYIFFKRRFWIFNIVSTIVRKNHKLKTYIFDGVTDETRCQARLLASKYIHISRNQYDVYNNLYFLFEKRLICTTM